MLCACEEKCYLPEEASKLIFEGQWHMGTEGVGRGRMPTLPAYMFNGSLQSKFFSLDSRTMYVEIWISSCHLSTYILQLGHPLTIFSILDLRPLSLSPVLSSSFYLHPILTQLKSPSSIRSVPTAPCPPHSYCPMFMAPWKGRGHDIPWGHLYRSTPPLAGAWAHFTTFHAWLLAGTSCLWCNNRTVNSSWLLAAYVYLGHSSELRISNTDALVEYTVT